MRADLTDDGHDFHARIAGDTRRPRALGDTERLDGARRFVLTGEREEKLASPRFRLQVRDLRERAALARLDQPQRRGERESVER